MNLIVLVLLMQLGTGPYPPNRYPGQSPGGIPFPRKGKKTDPSKAENLQVLHGWVRSADAKMLRLYTSDSRTVEIQLGDKTRKPEKALVEGDYVDVEVAQDEKGQYLAATVKKTDPPKGEKPPRAELPIESTENKPEAAPAPEKKSDERRSEEKKTEVAKQAEPPVPPEPPSTIVKPQEQVSDADARPRLRRGIPARKKSEAAEDEVEVASAAAPGPTPNEVRVIESTGEVRRVSGPEADPKMDLLAQARNQSVNFLEGLPNYMCKQFTTRYAGGGKPVNWRALDVVSADLVYEDGRERYQNLAINGKLAKGKMEDSGSWSTGEFGTVLNDLFSPSTAAAFHYAGTMTVQRRPATQYDFTVDQEGSHWHIAVPGQYVEPEYRGSLWVDKETGRVLRIEMEARKISKDFPLDTTEMAIDYDFVTLGGVQKFLLPVKAEILSCQRGTSDCQKNTIEFRNYRKFGAQSDIIFKD